jgi:hypothetical protein
MNATHHGRSIYQEFLAGGNPPHHPQLLAIVPTPPPPPLPPVHHTTVYEDFAMIIQDVVAELNIHAMDDYNHFRENPDAQPPWFLYYNRFVQEQVLSSRFMQSVQEFTRDIAGFEGYQEHPHILAQGLPAIMSGHMTSADSAFLACSVAVLIAATRRNFRNNIFNLCVVRTRIPLPRFSYAGLQLPGHAYEYHSFVVCRAHQAFHRRVPSKNMSFAELQQYIGENACVMDTWGPQERAVRGTLIRREHRYPLRELEEQLKRLSCMMVGDPTLAVGGLLYEVTDSMNISDIFAEHHHVVGEMQRIMDAAQHAIQHHPQHPQAPPGVITANHIRSFFRPLHTQRRDFLSVMGFVLCVCFAVGWGFLTRALRL